MASIKRDFGFRGLSSPLGFPALEETVVTRTLSELKLVTTFEALALPWSFDTGERVPGHRSLAA
jgi:hypothetical protein